MKLVPLFRTDTSAAKRTIATRSLIKVCMHVREAARTDGRVMREATALEEAGFTVSIVDVEHERLCSVEEVISGIRVKHIFRSSSFISPRFNLWSFFKTMRSHIYNVY